MMKKSILFGAVAAVFASGAAYADVIPTSTYCKPGFYVGVQGGRADTFYKNHDVLAPAASTGNYSRTQTVASTVGDLADQTTLTSRSQMTSGKVDDIVAGGRLFAGYQFNPYFATELGYTQFGKTSFTGTSVANISAVTTKQYGSNTSETLPSNVTNYNGQVTEHAVDLVAKGTLPLQYGFGAYAKAGAAYISADRSINAIGSPAAYVGTTAVSGTTVNSIYTKTYQAFRPTYGAGIDYTIPNTSVDVDASWTRIQGMGNAIPNADLLALGLSYKFA